VVDFSPSEAISTVREFVSPSLGGRARNGFFWPGDGFPHAKGFAKIAFCRESPERKGTMKADRGIAALLLGVMFGYAACSTMPEAPQPVTHVILMWLKHPRSSSDRAQLVRGTQSLRMMPGITQVETGRTLPAMNQPVDRSFDLASVITFRDRAAFARYERDPRHHAELERYLAPFVRRFEVINLQTR
jgi:hypothetical protein